MSIESTNNKEAITQTASALSKLETSDTKTQLESAMQGSPEINEITSEHIKLYHPLIKEFIGKESNKVGGSFGGDRALGEQIFHVVCEKLALDKATIGYHTDYALRMINSDDFGDTDEKKREFLIQYLSFFLSLQNYLNYSEDDHLKFSRLASPPIEAYEYVGHNRLSFPRKESYAAMFDD